MAEDARAAARRIVEEVLAAHAEAEQAANPRSPGGSSSLEERASSTDEAAPPVDTAPAVEPDTSVDPGASVDPGTSVEPGAPVEPGPSVDPGPSVEPGLSVEPTPPPALDPRSEATAPTVVADELDERPSRVVARRIVAEVLAAHAAAEREVQLPAPTAEAAGPPPIPEVVPVQPVPGRPAIVPGVPAAAVAPDVAVDTGPAAVAEDAASIARRIVESVLAEEELRARTAIEDVAAADVDAGTFGSPDPVESGGSVGSAARRHDEPFDRDDPETTTALPVVRGPDVTAPLPVQDDPGADPTVVHELEDTVALRIANDLDPDVPGEVVDGTAPASAAGDDVTIVLPDAHEPDGDASGEDAPPPPDGRTPPLDPFTHEPGPRRPDSPATVMNSDSRVATMATPAPGSQADEWATEGWQGAEANAPLMTSPGAESRGWGSAEPDQDALHHDEWTADGSAGDPAEVTRPVPSVTPPPRRSRWIVASILGAIGLAVLLPLAIDALRSLVALS